jgi:putative ABC transport system permease protein
MLELWNRLRDRFRRDRLASELDEELRFHRTMLERDRRVDGATDDEARRIAQLQLGNSTYLRETTRAMWTFGWFDDLLQDVRYASRVLRHNLSFTVAVVLTLSLGIGANTAIFSVVNAVILRPLPYADPSRLVSVWSAPVGAPNSRNPTSYPDLVDWQAQNTVFSAVGGYAFNRFELTSSTTADQARAILAMPQVYEALRATPLLGRLPGAGEQRLPVVAISYRLWRRRFGGNSSVLGTKTILNEKPYTIIGVMPPGFHFPSPDIDLWMSMQPLSEDPTSPWLTSRSLHGYRVIARLEPGVTAAAAEAQMNTIMHRLGQAYPDDDAGIDIRLSSIQNDSVGGVQRALWLTLGAAGLVLLLACANVSHLMLARMSTRSRELAVRRALGAHRGRVLRQLLTESVLLGMLGGAAGLAVAMVTIRVLLRLSPGDIPRLETVSLDGTTLLFATAASLATGILFGAAPAILALRGSHAALREQSRGSVGGAGTRVRSLLTAAEVAFALMLVVAAGLMVRSFVSLLSTNPGFRPDGALAFSVVLSDTRYPGPPERDAVVRRIVQRLGSLPGVTSVGASTSMAPNRWQQASGFSIEGEPAPTPGHEPTAIYVPSTPRFLSSLGVPLLAGRDFTDADGASSPRVVIVSRELVRRHFGRRDPLGRELRLDRTTWLIVGVAGDVTYEGIGKPAGPAVYVPFSQSTFGGVWIAVRTSVPLASLAEPIRGALHEIDPLMNARELAPMESFVSSSIVRPRFQTWLLGSFGAVALLLAAIGIYGVISYGVAQRTSEIGLRLALGAPQRSVVSLVLGRGMLPVIAGVAIGLTGSLAFSRIMSGLLYGVAPTDLTTFAVTTALLIAISLIAAYVPAARAGHLDPLGALREG